MPGEKKLIDHAPVMATSLQTTANRSDGSCKHSQGDSHGDACPEIAMVILVRQSEGSFVVKQPTFHQGIHSEVKISHVM